MLKQTGDLDLAALNAGATTFEEITLLFLPPEAQAFREVLDTIAKRAKKSRAAVLLGSLDDFDALFDATVRTKGALNIINSAMALRAVARLALERLDQIEAENAAG